MRISDWSSDVCSSDLGEQSAEHHRLHFLEAGQRRWRGVLDRGNGVADHRLRHFLDLRGDEADFAGSKLRHLLNLRPETADAVNQMLGATCHELDLQPLLENAVHYTDQNDHAPIRDRTSTRLNSSHS